MGEDAELEEMIRANRHAGGRRLLIVGLIVTAASGALAGYAHHLDVEQRMAPIKFTLPERLAIFGVFGMVIGALLLCASTAMFIRGRSHG